MFRQLKGKALREIIEREAAQRLVSQSVRRAEDEQTNDLHGFPTFPSDFDQRVPLLAPCQAYDRDDEEAN